MHQVLVPVHGSSLHHAEFFAAITLDSLSKPCSMRELSSQTKAAPEPRSSALQDGFLTTGGA